MALETAVMDRKGEISLFDAGLVQTAMRWERHALLAQRWLKKEAANMTHSDRLAFSREVARASESRDRALKELGLARTSHDRVIADLYANSEPEDTE